jgi:hypothetical protein
MTHDDQPDELPPGDSYDCAHGAYCVQCGPTDVPMTTLADPDKPCYHPEFEVVTAIARVGEDDPNNTMPGMPTAFVAEITIKCGACGEAFKFDGVPAGLSYDAPATSVDGRELRAPIRPVSLPPRRERIQGRAISGYSIRQTGTSPLGLPDGPAQ